jgi:hypothetical protein
MNNLKGKKPKQKNQQQKSIFLKNLICVHRQCKHFLLHSIKSCHVNICKNILGIYLEKWHNNVF